MGVTEYIFVGLIIFVSGLAQSAIGFGFALFATPLLLFYGLPLPVIVVLLSVSSFLQSAIGATKLRSAIPWRLSVKASAIAFIGMFIGVLFLRALSAWDPDKLQGLVGICLCLLVVAQMTLRPSQMTPLHKHWGTTAFLTSGFLGGACGMSGPPLVLWSLSQPWSTQTLRGFLFASFAMRIPVQIALLAFAFGSEMLWSILYAFMLTPFVYLGTRIGLPLGDRINRKDLERIAYAILLVVGVLAIAQSW